MYILCVYIFVCNVYLIFLKCGAAALPSDIKHESVELIKADYEYADLSAYHQHNITVQSTTENTSAYNVKSITNVIHNRRQGAEDNEEINKEHNPNSETRHTLKQKEYHQRLFVTRSDLPQDKMPEATHGTRLRNYDVESRTWPSFDSYPTTLSYEQQTTLTSNEHQQTSQSHAPLQINHQIPTLLADQNQYNKRGQKYQKISMQSFVNQQGLSQNNNQLSLPQGKSQNRNDTQISMRSFDIEHGLLQNTNQLPLWKGDSQNENDTSLNDEPSESQGDLETNTDNPEVSSVTITTNVSPAILKTGKGHEFIQEYATAAAVSPLSKTTPNVFNILRTKTSTLIDYAKIKETFSKFQRFIQKNEWLLKNLLTSSTAKATSSTSKTLPSPTKDISRPSFHVQPTKNKEPGALRMGIPLEEILEEKKGPGRIRITISHEEKDAPVPDDNQLDMSPARGPRMEKLRVKGRLCQRHVMVPEGPKYDSKGMVYLKAFSRRHKLGTKGPDYHQTKPRRLLLPRCCNCCKKSVLGCE